MSTLSLLFVLVATLLAAGPLVRLDLPAIEGALLASGSGERVGVKVLFPLLLLGGVAASALLGGSPRDLQAGLLPATDGSILVAVGLSSVAAVLISGVISPRTGAAYAVLGAIFGCQLMARGTMDWSGVLRYAGSWVVASLLCGVLSVGLTAAVSSRERHRKEHLAFWDRRMLKGSILASLFLSGAAGWNAGLLTGLFPVATFGGGPLAATLSAGCALLLAIGLVRGISESRSHVADKDLDVYPGLVLAVLVAMGLTYALFSSPWVLVAGLAPTPLSAPSLFLSALVGGSLVRGTASVEGDELVQGAVATAVAPVLGLLICYSLCMILGVPALGHGGALLTPVLIILGIAAVAAGLFLYMRIRRRRALQAELLRAREQQVQSARKSLSAIEVKAEMTEKDLMNKLEIKRKELVDFAVGISEQKQYMEEVYGRLRDIRALDGTEAKDAATDALLQSLRERMYFTREMNDFYAQTEILHKDFNMRLKEAFPNLTENERKLANLLRQGFSSKYIASLMNITPKSVEISRYRLRTKLGLRRSDNLVQFIKAL